MGIEEAIYTRWVQPCETGHAGPEVRAPAVIVGIADDEVGFVGEKVGGAG